MLILKYRMTYMNIIQYILINVHVDIHQVPHSIVCLLETVVLAIASQGVAAPHSQINPSLCNC